MRYLQPQSPERLVPDEAALHERIADALRMAVALRGPHRPEALAYAVERSLRGLAIRDSAREVGPEVRRVLARLVDDGDLVRGDRADDDSLHARPLCIVHGPSGRHLLIGACLKTEAQVADAAGQGLRRLGHRRWLDANAQLPADVSLPRLGEDLWIRQPSEAELDGAPETAARLLVDQPGLGPLDHVAWLQPGGARWDPAEGAPAGLQVLRRETPWGQRRWYLVCFGSGGVAGPALQLPCAQLPAADTAHGQGATLHLLLSHRGHRSCTWSWLDGDLLELSALPPPWLSRQLDLRGDRDGGRRWRVTSDQRSPVERILLSARFSPRP